MTATTETTAAKSVVDEEQRRVWLHVYATEFSNAWARDLDGTWGGLG